MTEEFNKMMNTLNKKPMEIQIKGFTKILEIMVNILHKFIDNYYLELEIINNKILALETKDIIADLPRTIALTPLPTPPPPQNRPVGIQSVRTAVIGELNDIFKKHRKISGLTE